jgi:hypothetical protein
VEAQNGAIEEVVDAQSGGKRLKIEPWGIGRQVIAVSHNFEEERFLDPISGSTPKCKEGS